MPIRARQRRFTRARPVPKPRAAPCPRSPPTCRRPLRGAPAARPGAQFPTHCGARSLGPEALSPSNQLHQLESIKVRFQRMDRKIASLWERHFLQRCWFIRTMEGSMRFAKQNFLFQVTKPLPAYLGSSLTQHTGQLSNLQLRSCYS